MAPRRILIIDDEPIDGVALFELLRDEGYEVDLASDGAQATAKLDDFRPDVVLADVRVPGMDGRRVVEMARVHGSHPAVVLMSARPSPSALGSPVLAKPVEVDRLLDALAHACAGRETERRDSV